MKQRLSAIFIAVSAASLLMVSTASFAGHKKGHESARDCKGENYKAEVPPPCPPILMLHDGFYVGAGAGYDSYRFSASSTTTVADVETAHSSWHSSATGWMGGLFAGYGQYFDWFYLGGELNVNFSGANGSFHASDAEGDILSTDVEARTSWGLALLPGMKINDSTLLYVRLGYLRTDFKGKVDFTDTDTIPPTTGSFSNNNWRNGFQYGVGLESYVAECVSVRGEYTHTAYSSKTSHFTDPVTGETDSLKLEPSNNEFMLSLVYHFVM